MRPLLTSLVLSLTLLLSSGCSPTRASDPTLVGRDGWVKTDIVPGKTIHVQSGLKAIWITPSDEGAQEYLVQVKPAGTEAPVYPNAPFLRGKHYLYKEYRYYALPEGKTFQNVYDWYMDWFAFGKAQK
ncbi:MAG: hypothetical protein HYY93_10760 [Planctomycetes bacterium]|nr:hypothetical protein [Planctomycetota bacterium]